MTNAEASMTDAAKRMIEEASRQPGVFEVMQLMQQVNQHQQALAALQPVPAFRVSASFSSLPTFS